MTEIVDSIVTKIKELNNEKNNIIVAIDGKCGSGKTTLTNYLKDILNCNVIPMDHFFLPSDRRTKKRLNEPGGNIDYERFYCEVLENLILNRDFSYSAFDCQTQKKQPPIDVIYSNITIVEGAYSCHPKFRDYYDLRIFLSIDKTKQKERILLRNGKDSYKDFESKWIPLEELYFSGCDVQNSCEMFFSL